ncbi:MAG TPA: hypothetical protein VFR49_00430 [Solirubrobacteraceae bacterium]|nr:hypothetical protein [Solirubrobacteraceae bacterium]
MRRLAALTLTLVLVLAGLALGTAGSAVGTRLGAGLSIAVPAGWHLALRLTGLAEPVERFTLASFPLRRPPDAASSCGPVRAVDAIPAAGALVFVFEYGPHGTSAGEFPPRPRHFAVPAGPARPYECFGLGWLLRFRVGSRRFQAMIALGRRAGPERARLLAALDSLRVDAAGAGH